MSGDWKAASGCSPRAPARLSSCRASRASIPPPALRWPSPAAPSTSTTSTTRPTPPRCAGAAALRREPPSRDTRLTYVLGYTCTSVLQPRGGDRHEQSLTPPHSAERPGTIRQLHPQTSHLDPVRSPRWSAARRARGRRPRSWPGHTWRGSRRDFRGEGVPAGADVWGPRVAMAASDRCSPLSRTWRSRTAGGASGERGAWMPCPRRRGGGSRELLSVPRGVGVGERSGPSGGVIARLGGGQARDTVVAPAFGAPG